MIELLTKEYYGNTLKTWLISLLIIFGAMIVGKLVYWVFGRVVKRLTAKTENKLDDIIVDMIEEPIAIVITIAGVWYALSRLNLSASARGWLNNAIQFVVILAVAWLITRLFDALYKQYLVPIAEKSESDLDDQLLPVVRSGTKLVVWALGVIMALNNAGYNVGAALAGLGIGGLALAMAGKDTVANMFGGLTIFIDQPFMINDRVKVGGFDGTVTEIGLRSTRLKTLEGRKVTIPNATFSGGGVENVSAEPNRKVVVKIGLVYGTTAEQMKDAMDTFRKIAEEHSDTEEDIRTGFSEFADSAMVLTFIYFIKKEGDIMQTQTDINLALLTAFDEKSLEMAYPTQTIHTKAA